MSVSDINLPFSPANGPVPTTPSRSARNAYSTLSTPEEQYLQSISSSSSPNYGSQGGGARLLPLSSGSDAGAAALVKPPSFHCNIGSVLVVLFVLCVGGVGTVQSAINHQAGEHFGTFLIGTWISFTGGVALLFLLVLLEMRVKGYKLLAFKARPKWHQVLPGAMGVTYVSATVGLTTVTGFALFFIAAVVGQLITSAVLDQFGWLGSRKMPLTPQKIIALTVAIGGAILSSVDRLTASEKYSTGVEVACVLAAVVAGVLLPIQTALNRSCSELLPSKLQTTLFSFLIGLAVCTIAAGIMVGADSSVAHGLSSNLASSEWWMYIGGPGGVLYIASGIWFVQAIGSAAFFVALVCGQLSGSAAIDATGFLGTDAFPASVDRIVGICLVIAAASMMQFALPFHLCPCNRKARKEYLEQSTPLIGAKAGPATPVLKGKSVPQSPSRSTSKAIAIRSPSPIPNRRREGDEMSISLTETVYSRPASR